MNYEIIPLAHQWLSFTIIYNYTGSPKALSLDESYL